MTGTEVTSREVTSREVTPTIEVTIEVETIEADDMVGAEIGRFLSDHVEQLRSLSPPESSHALDLDGLRAAAVTVWAARHDGLLIGCAALKELPATTLPGSLGWEGSQGEIKSMRTAQEWRGHGVASALLRHLIGEARSRGWCRLSLETGTDEFFAPARRLYLRHGFVECEPFADYVLDPLSVFMTRAL